MSSNHLCEKWINEGCCLSRKKVTRVHTKIYFIMFMLIHSVLFFNTAWNSCSVMSSYQGLVVYAKPQTRYLCSGERKEVCVSDLILIHLELYCYCNSFVLSKNNTTTFIFVKFVYLFIYFSDSK
jgi:hypothetical protein